MRAALLVLLLTGCTSFNTLQGQVAGRGAAAADEVRETAQWTLCSAISVGSWVRAYGSSKEKAEAWRTLCSTKADATP